MRSIVTDGVTLGHPCCAEPLIMAKGARFCLEHSEKEAECAIIGCTTRVSVGFSTCSPSSHRALEDYKLLANKSMFTLKQRLERLKTGSGNAPSGEDISETPDEQSLDVVGDFTNPNDPSFVNAEPLGNRRLRAQFGRRRTHNEELAVASCGGTVGRATFFGSEAINGVLVRFPTLLSTLLC